MEVLFWLVVIVCGAMFLVGSSPEGSARQSESEVDVPDDWSRSEGRSATRDSPLSPRRSKRLDPEMRDLPRFEEVEEEKRRSRRRIRELEEELRRLRDNPANRGTDEGRIELAWGSTYRPGGKRGDEG